MIHTFRLYEEHSRIAQCRLLDEVILNYLKIKSPALGRAKKRGEYFIKVYPFTINTGKPKG